jgi:hypothetical protein
VITGPGSYLHKSSFESAMLRRDFKQTGARSFTVRPGLDAPGPGNYSPTDTTSKLSAPKFGFGTDKKMKESKKFSGPSPNSYIVDDRISRKNWQSTGMGYGKKVDAAPVTVTTPGPGSYVKFKYSNFYRFHLVILMKVGNLAWELGKT